MLADPSNYTAGRQGYKVCKITPHHMAAIWTAERCAESFQNPNRNASANYCIGNDGTIVCNVKEENRAWTSSNGVNDCQAITIEVANSTGAPSWKVSDKAWKALVNLCVDICRRYGFRLNFNGKPSGSLTMHKMFAATSCPGPYLEPRMGQLAKEVNAILDGGKPTTPSTSTGSNPKAKSGYVEITYGGSDGLMLHSKPSWSDSTAAGIVKKGEVFTIVDGKDVDGVWMYKIKSGKWITSAIEYVKYRKTIGSSKPKPKKKKLYLPKTATSWNVYPLNKAPVIGNEVGKLNPSLFGGLEYEVLATPQTDVVTIQTRDFGKVNIYVAKETGAVIK